MPAGWTPSQESSVTSSRVRDLARTVGRAPLEMLRARSNSFVVWTPPALGGGNHLYMWLYAWHESSCGRPTKVLQQPGMDAWLDEFPRLRDFTVSPDAVPFSWQRGVVWNQDYPGADVMARFVREVLLSSERFQGRLADARELVRGAGVLNIRRGDYYTNPDVAKNYAMDYGYLLRMVASDVLATQSLTRLIVVSDDLDWCRAELPQLLPGIELEFPDAGAFGGLALLAATDHLVLSNSTFSYWGGYLSETIHEAAAQIWVPHFHSRNSVDGVVWQQAPTWHLLENLEHEMTRTLAQVSSAPASSSAPTRVVFLVNSMCRPNGVVSSVLALARAWRDAGIAVHIASLGEVDPDVAEDFDTTLLRPWVKLTTETYDFDGSRALLKLPRVALTPAVHAVDRRRVAGVLDQLDEATLVIAAGMECLEYVGPQVRRAGLVAVQVHLTFEALEPDQLERLDRCRDLADVVTTLTVQDAEHVRRRCGGEVVSLANASLVPRHAPSEAAKRVVYVGRLADIKQVDHAIEAFAQVAPKEWVFDVFGKGPQEGALREIATASGARVRFRGVIDDPAVAFAGAGIHVLSSMFEGMPMTVVEASRLGVPTVAYECAPGVREAVGEHGILVPPQDREALAAALGELMQNETKRARLADQAWRDDRFDEEMIMKEWGKAWSRTCQQR